MRARDLVAFWMATAVMVSGCTKAPAEDEKPIDPIVPVRVRALERRTFADVVLAPGQWRSSGDMVISVPFDAVVESVAVRPGDRARAGQPLAFLVTRESQAALRGAELLLSEAREAPARAEAERALALAHRDLVRVPLTAPRAGVVSHRAAEPGAQVSAGAEVLTLVPLGAMVFEARIPARDAARVHPGQRATVRAEGRPAHETVVQRLLPVAGAADQSALAWLQPLASEETPEIDRYAVATIAVGASRPAVGIPDSAVVEDDLTGAARIAVVDSSGRALWTTVTLGGSTSGWRELRAPALIPGTRVVVDGQRGLPDRVRLRPEP